MKMEAVRDPDSIAKVAALAAEIWPEYYTPIVGERQVSYMLQKFQSPEAIAGQIREGASYYRAQLCGQNIGYLAVRPDPEHGALYVSKIYLRIQDRGKGYGRKMMDFIETLAKREALPKLSLRVHKRNATVGVYETLGFRIVQSLTQDLGGGFVLDDYQMEKVLS